jgi:ABC-type phosphate transport system substrate-binding protein
MNRLKLGLVSTVAVVGCFGAVDTANAQFLYSGGGTLASLVYRQLFDCYYYSIPGDTLSTSCTNTAGVTGAIAEILYAPVGSGAGQNAFVAHNPTVLGTPATTNTVPYTSSYETLVGTSIYPYPSLQFAGSDAVLSGSLYKTFQINQGGIGIFAKWGKAIEIPAFSTPVAIITKDPALSFTSGRLQLSRKSLCGIFSGHITDWSDAQLTADNGGVAIHSSPYPITLVHRSDGSGTTFLLTQALLAQCGGQVGPTSTGSASFSLYEFPWSDANATCPAPLTPPVPFQPTTKANWFDINGTHTDQCGAPIPNPGGMLFANASGSGGVANLVSTTAGAIGYVSPDFAAPVNPSGPAMAAVQDQFDIDNNFTTTPTYVVPSPASANLAMLGASADFSNSDITDPLNWSAQGVVPNPNLNGAYPISGFTWFYFYQCYAPGQNFTLIQNYLIWHYTAPLAATILNNNGFSPIPTPWLNAATNLVGGTMGTAGAGACAGVAPGA